jgi:SAM-dependent methyltransferase
MRHFFIDKPKLGETSLLTLLDPRSVFPGRIRDLEEIVTHSLLPGRRIGWNYPLDYLFIMDEVLRRGVPRGIVLDVGAGPGAIHGYLEQTLGIEIVGIDTQRWEHDYVDALGNFLDDKFLASLGIYPGNLDLIISTSAFEHQSLRKHKRCIQQCRKYLTPDGAAIITTTTSGSRTRLNLNPRQWDASRRRLSSIYGLSWDRTNTREVSRAYQSSPQLREAYVERFGSVKPNFPPYLSVGAVVYPDTV